MSNYFNLGKERGMNTFVQKTLKVLLLATMMLGLVANSVSNSVITINAEEVKTVETLIVDETTLAEAFPDKVFRSFVYTSVLGKGTYDDSDSSHKSYVLTQTDIDLIEARTAIYILDVKSAMTVSGAFQIDSEVDGELRSIEGIQHFIGITSLNIRFTDLAKKLDLSNNKSLEFIRIDRCFLEEINLDGLTNLSALYIQAPLSEIDLSTNTALTLVSLTYIEITGVLDLSAQENLEIVGVTFSKGISGITFADGVKSNITSLQYMGSGIEMMDLEGFSSLTLADINKAENLDLSSATRLSIGSLEATHMNILNGSAGFATADGKGNYEIASGTTATYTITPTVDRSEYKYPGSDINHSFDATNLPNGGIIDSFGNLVVGQDYMVESDGTIVLANGGTLITLEGVKYTFDGSTTLKDGVITTSEVYTSTAPIIPPFLGRESGATEPMIADGIITIVDSKDGEVTINTQDHTAEVPSGTVLTDENGDSIAIIGDATVDSEGNITSGNIWAEVPDGDDVTVDPDTGVVTLPDGGTIHYPNGDTETLVGETVITPPDQIKYSDTDLASKIGTAITALDKNSSGSIDVGDGITLTDIEKIQDLVDQIQNPSTKQAQQTNLDNAIKDYVNALLADLVDSGTGKTKTSATEADFANIQEFIDAIDSSIIKDSLKTDLDAARLSQIEAMLDELEDPGTSRIPTNVILDDFADVEAAVNNITNPTTKAAAQVLVDAAKAQLIEDMLTEVDARVTSNPESVLADDYTPIQDLIDSLTNRTAKDQLQEDINDLRAKQINDMIDLLLVDPSDPDSAADPTKVTEAKLEAIEDLIVAMPECDQKDEVIARFIDKFITEFYDFLVVKKFDTYTGNVNVPIYAKIIRDDRALTEVWIKPVGSPDSEYTKLESMNHYIASNGSTILLMLPGYLNTLPNGAYDVKAVYGDPSLYVPLELVVAKSTTPTNPTNPNVPNTGVGESILPWLGLMALSAGSITFLAKKKKTEEAVEEVE